MLLWDWFMEAELGDVPHAVVNANSGEVYTADYGKEKGNFAYEDYEVIAIKRNKYFNTVYVSSDLAKEDFDVKSLCGKEFVEIAKLQNAKLIRRVEKFRDQQSYLGEPVNALELAILILKSYNEEEDFSMDRVQKILNGEEA